MKGCFLNSGLQELMLEEKNWGTYDLPSFLVAGKSPADLFRGVLFPDPSWESLYAASLGYAFHQYVTTLDSTLPALAAAQLKCPKLAPLLHFLGL